MGEKYYECQGMNRFEKINLCGNRNKGEKDKGKGVKKVQGVENKVGTLFLCKVGTGRY